MKFHAVQIFTRIEYQADSVNWQDWKRVYKPYLDLVLNKCD